MVKLLKTGILVGLGLSWKAKEFVDDLVKKGEENPSEMAKKIRELAEATERSGKEMKEKLSGLCGELIKRVKSPSQEDIQRLEKEIAALAARLGPRR